MELFFLFVYLALEHVRIFQGKHLLTLLPSNLPCERQLTSYARPAASKGNKIEQIGPLVRSVVIAIGVVVIHVFYLQLQTYVLKIDRILNGIGLAFIGIESILMLFTALSFWRDVNL